MKSLSVDERKWLSARFPGLHINETDKLSISGDLTVDMFYDETLDNGYVIFPDENVRSSDYYIHDVYQIRANYDDALFIPEVYETSGRIKTFAQRRNILLPDLHVNNWGNLCLCPKSLERVKLSDPHTIQDFFTLLVIPFFYSQSFFEKFNRWPWKDYSHGDTGILECYADYIMKVHDKTKFVENTINSLNSGNQKILRSADQITRQSLCFCGSGKKFRKCHHEAWEAVKGLKRELSL
jgi:hypothetical protein